MSSDNKHICEEIWYAFKQLKTTENMKMILTMNSADIISLFVVLLSVQLYDMKLEVRN